MFVDMIFMLFNVIKVIETDGFWTKGVNVRTGYLGWYPSDHGILYGKFFLLFGMDRIFCVLQKIWLSFKKKTVMMVRKCIMQYTNQILILILIVLLVVFICCMDRCY